MEEMVTITKKEYDRLISDSFALQCLEAGGVDNWKWYSESLKDWRKKYDFDEGDEDPHA